MRAIAIRVAWACLLACLVWAGAPSLAPAQEAPPVAALQSEEIDYDAWETEARRAENLITNAVASTAFFENLRSNLTGWRARFLAVQADGQARIDSLEAQVEALGLPPEEGETEPRQIAERREALAASLAEAIVPRANASEASVRADSLIRDIDAILRKRQQDRILELGPSPANPVNWAAAATSLQEVARVLRADFTTRFNDPIRREAAADQAPVIVLFGLLGLLALTKGRSLTKRVTLRLQRRANERGRAAAAFVVSLAQIAVPLLGAILILAAALATDMFAARSVALLEAVTALVMATLFGLWLAGRLFPPGQGPLGLLVLEPAQKTACRRALVGIGVLFGVGAILQTLADFNEVSPAARSVVTFPVYVLMGLTFWRFAGSLRAGIPEPSEDEGTGFARASISIVARALQLVGLAGPVLAVIGYTNAAEALMLPSAMTIAILSIIVALQPLIRDLYALVSGTTHSTASEALLPVLINFFLVFAAVPLVLLAWGMRADQLTSVYTRFWEGTTLGGIQITPGTVLAVLGIFAIGVIVTRLFQGALRTTVLPRTRLDVGARNAINSGIGYIGIGIAAVVAISAGGIDLTALGVVIGALSVGIGFGLQNVVNNFVSGIILLIERPISEGDWIEVNGNMGIVKRISVRSTRIETFDRTDVIVPNGDFISGTVTNWTRGNTIGRAIVTVGVAYGTDTRRVEQMLKEIANGHPDVATFPEPAVDFLGFGADSLDFRVRMILRDINKLLVVKNEVHHQIAERFTEEGIEIPFAQRDIWLRNPESLRAQAGAPPAPATDPDQEGPETT